MALYTIISKEDAKAKAIYYFKLSKLFDTIASMDTVTFDQFILFVKLATTDWTLLEIFDGRNFKFSYTTERDRRKKTFMLAIDLFTDDGEDASMISELFEMYGI